MTRPFIIAALGSLLVSAPATAERRRASRDDDSRRAIGKVGKVDRKNEEAADDVDDDRPARAPRKADRKSVDRDRAAREEDRSAKKRERKERVADVESAEDSDGPEAQAVLPIKLDELIEVAVRLSPELARAKADRTIARGGAGAARKEQSWILGAEANYAINAVSREVEVDPLQPVREDQAKASLTLGRKLPTGGFFGVELGMTRVGKEIAIPQEYIDAVATALGQNPQAQTQEVPPEYYTTHQAIAKLTLTQPLARGFGPDVALAAEKRADLELSEATVKTQLAAEQMIFEVVSGYWELAYLGYSVDVRNEAVILAEAQEKATREEIRAGSQPATAINAITFEISTRKEALLTAQLEFEKKSLELRRKIGLELSKRQIALRPAEAFEIGADEWDVEDVLKRSRKANRRLLALGIQRKLAEVDVKVAKNGMLPQVDLSLSGGLVGTGTSQDAAFSGIGAANGYQVMAGLKVEFELSGAAKAAHEAAVAKKARVEVDRADLARTLDAEVVAAVKAVTAARARVGLSDKAIYVAEENVKVEKQSFLAGRSDNFRVMDRQTQLVDARLRRGRAVADYHTTVAQLQQLSGLLLEQHRVDVRPGR
ncbi:MAG TPA: TolC family protein [Kofleriaceae bacterium]|nr:TolC family protein [Kofleriaceae bacterium]